MRGKARYIATVAAGFTVIGVSIGLFYHCNAAFIKPVSDALDFSRGEFTICNTISLLVSMFLLPFYGTLIKKYGIKKLMIIGTVICSIVPVFYSFSTSLWQFYLISTLNGLFTNCISILAVGTLINNWFKDKKGLATAVAFSGSGFVSAIMVSVITGIIEQAGWQFAYITIGIIGIIVLMPIVLFVVVDRPEDVGLLQYSNDQADKVVVAAEPKQEKLAGLTRAEALKAPTFWFVVIALAGLAFVFMGLSNHTISYLRDLGYAPLRASAVHSMYLLLLVITKVLIGMAADKFGPFAAAMISGSFCIVVPVMGLFAYVPQIPWAYAACLSVASSAGTVLPSLITARYFGEKNFSAIYSLLTMAGTAGGAVSPPVIGFIFDFTGSYTPALYVCVVIGMIGSAAHILAYKKRPLLNGSGSSFM